LQAEVLVQVAVVVQADYCIQTQCQSIVDNLTGFKLVPVELAATDNIQHLTDILQLVVVQPEQLADQVVEQVGVDNTNGVLLHQVHPVREVREAQDTITQTGDIHTVVAVEPVLLVHGVLVHQEVNPVRVDQVLLTQLTEHQHILPVVAVADKVVVLGLVAVVPVVEAVIVPEHQILVAEEAINPADQELLSSVTQDHKELLVV
jgi:hypothetical protein